LLKEDQVVFFGTEEVVLCEELDCLSMIDPGSHDEQLALLTPFSESLLTMCEHLSLEESLSEDLENGFTRRKANVVLSLGSI
jgi:hypothetical protein